MRREKKVLRYKGNDINYTLIYRPNQVNYRMKNEFEEIVVSVPEGTSQWEVDRFIYKYIKSFLRLFEYKKKCIHFQYEEQSFIKIWGVNQEVNFLEDITRLNTTDKNIFKRYDDAKDTTTHMYKRLSKLYYNDFQNRVNYWKEVMGLELKNLTVRAIKGKWGVCFPKENKIVLNIRLIHYPPECLDGVIVHELTHLVHLNHSKDFKYMVLRYFPNYKSCMDLLKS